MTLARNWLVVVVVGGGIAGGLALQQRSMAALRTEVERLTDQDRRCVALEIKNQQLRQSRPSADVLGRLRNDHVAIERLRAEVEALRLQLEKAER